MLATIRTRLLPLLRTIGLELLVVAGLFLAYRWARLLVGHSGAVAFDNARELVQRERTLRLPSELTVQHGLLANETVTWLANVYYASVHFPLTGVFLVWLFWRSRQHYYRIRTSLALLTGMALVVHAAFPLAPARMLDGLGFVDTAAMYGPTVYDGPPEADSLANQFAAMPSLHFGWAVVVALGVVRVSRSRWRWLWVAHPAVTLLVIVGTGNHYWLDAIVAGVLLAIAEYVVYGWSTGLGRRLVGIEAGFGVAGLAGLASPSYAAAPGSLTPNDQALVRPGPAGARDPPLGPGRHASTGPGSARPQVLAERLA